MKGFMKDNKYYLGINYWASHASINMWSDWRADVVDSDFAKLAAIGVKYLRVFPLWPVFQPLRCIWANMQRYEYRMGPDEQPLPDTEAGRAGVSEEACAHFAEFCALAEKHGLKLIVGLLTGHMSFRFYWPEAFEGKNFLSDPTVIKWELRFVRYFVKRFKNESSILAWDLGNECNALMGGIEPDQAYVWASAITSAIRESDENRAVVSGLDIAACDNSAFNIRELSEIVDIHTTHPYQIFSATAIDPINSIRAEIDPTVRANLTETLGGKPCFVEEVGSIGYTNCSEATEADFLRTMYFSTWANGNHGLFWWCAFDQGHLTFAPYDWNNIGSDYGFFRADGTEKPVAKVTREFADFLESCPVAELPARTTEAVCIIQRGVSDPRRIADSAYILAKQANFDITFAHAEEKLPDSPLYLFPSINQNKPIFLRRLDELLEKVRNGAILYMSFDDTLFRRLPELTGLTVASRERGGNEKITMDGEVFMLGGSFKYNIESVADTCTVLAEGEDGRPVFVCNNYGKGKIYFCTFPLERLLSERAGAFRHGAPEYFRFYEKFAAEIESRAVHSNDPLVLTSEHRIDENRRVIVALNYADTESAWVPELRGGFKIAKLYRGVIGQVPAHDAVVFEVQK